MDVQETLLLEMTSPERRVRSDDVKGCTDVTRGFLVFNAVAEEVMGSHRIVRLLVNQEYVMLLLFPVCFNDGIQNPADNPSPLLYIVVILGAQIPKEGAHGWAKTQVATLAPSRRAPTGHAGGRPGTRAH